MVRELNKFEVFWQCPKCKCPNKSVTTDVLIDLGKFKCKECNRIYTLQKNVTQVLCEPISISI